MADFPPSPFSHSSSPLKTRHLHKVLWRSWRLHRRFARPRQLPPPRVPLRSASPLSALTLQHLLTLFSPDNYAEAMPPPIVSQIITSTGSIMGPSSFLYAPSLALLPSHLMDGTQGTDRLRRLAFNCRYLNGGLKKLGFIVFGHRDSPIGAFPSPLSIFDLVADCRYSTNARVRAWKVWSLQSPHARATQNHVRPILLLLLPLTILTVRTTPAS